MNSSDVKDKFEAIKEILDTTYSSINELQYLLNYYEKRKMHERFNENVSRKR